MTVWAYFTPQPNAEVSAPTGGLSHSRKVLCKICKHLIHFQCTNMSVDEFNVLIDGDEWACRSCSEKIFPFNKIVNDEILLKEIGVCFDRW